MREQKLVQGETCYGCNLSSSSVVPDVTVGAAEVSTFTGSHQLSEMADVRVSLKVNLIRV